MKVEMRIKIKYKRIKTKEAGREKEEQSREVVSRHPRSVCARYFAYFISNQFDLSYTGWPIFSYLFKESFAFTNLLF